jgi:hypothetical protein
MKASSQPYIKNATIPVSALLQLPANLYTISNPNTMVIKKGEYSGTVTIRPDSVSFLNDSLNTMYATYALPFRITDADADSLIKNQRTNVVGVRFENMLFGNYWHGGVAVVNRPSKPDTTYVYETVIPTPESKVWTLTTAGPSTVTSNGYFDQTTSGNELQLVLKGNMIYVSAAAGSTYAYEPDGESIFTRPKLLQDRKLILKYKYLNTDNNYTYHCTDTLAFRNRIRDGINEWQDENPSHYLK